MTVSKDTFTDVKPASSINLSSSSSLKKVYPPPGWGLSLLDVPLTAPPQQEHFFKTKQNTKKHTQEAKKGAGKVECEPLPQIISIVLLQGAVFSILGFEFCREFNV